MSEALLAMFGGAAAPAAATGTALAGAAQGMSGLGAAGTGLGATAAPVASSVAPGVAGIAQGVAPAATQAVPAAGGLLGQISNFFDSYTGQPGVINAVPEKYKPQAKAAANIAQKSGLVTPPAELPPQAPIEQPRYQPKPKQQGSPDPIVTEILARIFGNG